MIKVNIPCPTDIILYYFCILLYFTEFHFLLLFKRVLQTKKMSNKILSVLIILLLNTVVIVTLTLYDNLECEVCTRDYLWWVQIWRSTITSNDISKSYWRFLHYLIRICEAVLFHFILGIFVVFVQYVKNRTHL